MRNILIISFALLVGMYSFQSVQAMGEKRQAVVHNEYYYDSAETASAQQKAKPAAAANQDDEPYFKIQAEQEAVATENENPESIF